MRRLHSISCSSSADQYSIVYITCTFDVALKNTFACAFQNLANVFKFNFLKSVLPIRRSRDLLTLMSTKASMSGIKSTSMPELYFNTTF